MNKLVKLFSILALSASVAMVSCKGDQGETGPIGATGAAGSNGTNGTNGTNGKDGAAGAAGVAGTNGKDGNANVQSFEVVVKKDQWKDVLISAIGSSNSSKYGGVVITNSLITAEKFVMVFLKTGTTLKALPLIYTSELDNSVERLDYAYKTGQLEVYYRFQTQLFGGTVTTVPGQDLTLNVVATSKTVGAALEKSGVDMKNYDSVMKFLGESL